jgi:hypothetical protein
LSPYRLDKPRISITGPDNPVRPASRIGVAADLLLRPG